MKLDEMLALFEKHEDEFLEFDAIKKPRSKRPDIHAFLLLDELLPGNRDMVSAAQHDEIWLDVELENLAPVIGEKQIVELIRCGVRIDSNSGLAMFV